MLHIFQIGIVLVGGALIGIVLFIFWLITASWKLPACWHCGDPMPDGYWNYLPGLGFICQKCGKEINCPAWYEKNGHSRERIEQ